MCYHPADYFPAYRCTGASFRHTATAAQHARFGLAEAQRGLVPGGGSMTRLARQIPYAKAMEILLTGDPMSAEEAHRCGFVNDVVPQDKVLERAQEFATRLARNGPLAIRKIKECVLTTSGLTINEAFAVEDRLSAEVIVSKDAREGPRAFGKRVRQGGFSGSGPASRPATAVRAARGRSASRRWRGCARAPRA